MLKDTKMKIYKIIYEVQYIGQEKGFIFVQANDFEEAYQKFTKNPPLTDNPNVPPVVITIEYIKNIIQ